MNNEKLLLTPKEIANACRKVDIELYGKDIEDREPDTALESSVIPPEVEIRLMNKSICQAQLAKAKPIIEKQERKEITDLLDAEIAKIDKDERFHYQLATVHINAPLALIQTGMEAQMGLLKRLKQALEGEK